MSGSTKSSKSTSGSAAKSPSSEESTSVKAGPAEEKELIQNAVLCSPPKVDDAILCAAAPEEKSPSVEEKDAPTKDRSGPASSSKESKSKPSEKTKSLKESNSSDEEEVKDPAVKTTKKSSDKSSSSSSDESPSSDESATARNGPNSPKTSSKAKTSSKDLEEDTITKEDEVSTNSFTKGDPHFKTHGGEMYDFHGGCDMVLMDNPDFKDGLGMKIHIRTMIETWWSYVESSALRIGDDTLVVTGGSANEEWLYINGVPNKPMQDEEWHMVTFAGLDLRFKQSKIRAGRTREAHIYLGNGEKLFLKTFHNFVKIEMAAHGSEFYNGSLGLLGRFPDGKRVGRDGETLIEDVNEFGLAWQVKEDEPKLFHTYKGNGIVQASQQCAMPVDTLEKAQLRQRRLKSGLSMEEAENACSHLEAADERKACVFDVVATQDTSMGAVW